MMRLIRTWIFFPKLIQLIICTSQKWHQDGCLEMGAALSYYSLFSLFPIFLVILSVAGFLLGSDTDMVSDILKYAKELLPDSAYDIVQDSLFHLNHSSIGASVAGFFLLLLTASNVFQALDRSVDKIWRVNGSHCQSTTVKLRMAIFLREKGLAFSLVLSSAILMLLSLSAHIILKILQRMLEDLNRSIPFVQLDDVLILRGIHLGATFLVLNVIVMVLFKVLPSTRVRWSDIGLGAFLTTSLLTLLQELASNSVIHMGSQYRSYGLVGGVMVLLLWIYLICQVFLAGSEFTYVYTHLFGSRKNH